MRAMSIPYEALPDPGERFTLGEEIRTGVWARVSNPLRDKECFDFLILIAIRSSKLRIMRQAKLLPLKFNLTVRMRKVSLMKNIVF